VCFFVQPEQYLLILKEMDPISEKSKHYTLTSSESERFLAINVQARGSEGRRTVLLRDAGFSNQPQIVERAFEEEPGESDTQPQRKEVLRTVGAFLLGGDDC